MSNRFFIALMCMATLFMACNNEKKNNENEVNPDEGKSKYKGTWLTSPNQLDELLLDTVKNCYQFDMWCDGTTIGREYMWAPETAVIYLIKQMMTADYNVHGKYTKKYKYEKTEDKTEESCTSRVWEGAECWLETVTFPNEQGISQSEQEYTWLPEENMIERHNYYVSNSSEIGVLGHNYERVDSKTDKDACLAMNPDNNGGQGGQQGGGDKDYSKYDNTTEKCWEVTVKIYNMEVVTYIWCTERQLVQEFDKTNQQYTYHAAQPNDENSCEALNED